MFGVDDADHCLAHIWQWRYVQSQEKHAGILTVSPRKIYSAVKEGVRAKLHFRHKSGREVEKGDGEIILSEFGEEEEKEE